jgi:hypothetical protein
MKKLAAIAATAMVLAGAVLAYAGVVVDEQQIVDQPNGGKITRSRTVMIEGSRQKSLIDNGNRTVITDLTKGTMTMLDKPRKSYVEFPFPPRTGPLAAVQGNMLPTVSFKKTGARDKILGYSCEVYTGSGTVGTNAVSMTGCFSTSAPGATDYTGFQDEMASKVKGTPMANMGQIPAGVPLTLTVATTMGRIPTAGMSPDQAAKVNRLLANRQFVTRTQVTKITEMSLTPDAFEIPPGYQKQELPAMSGSMGMGGRGMSPEEGSTPSRKLPE